MASKSDYRANRSAYRENRLEIKEMIERQSSVIDRDYVLTSSLFRSFFLLGGLILVLAPRESLFGAFPLFLVAALSWAYRSLLNSRINADAIMWSERLLHREAARFAHFSAAEEEDNNDYIDDLLRIRTLRPSGTIQLLFEPAALLIASWLLILLRLNPPAFLGALASG
jgi:hypothetical protein